MQLKLIGNYINGYNKNLYIKKIRKCIKSVTECTYSQKTHIILSKFAQQNSQKTHNIY